MSIMALWKLLCKYTAGYWSLVKNRCEFFFLHSFYNASDPSHSKNEHLDVWILNVTSIFVCCKLISNSCRYESEFSQCRPILASSLLNIMQTLLDQSRQDDMCIIGCEALFDFTVAQVSICVVSSGCFSILRMLFQSQSVTELWVGSR